MRDKRVVLRDARMFEAFRDVAWPVMRRVVRGRLSERCQVCVLSARAAPLQDGVCEECRRASADASLPERSAASSVELHRQLDDILAAHAGGKSRAYDALVLFSGGKDSAYLVERLRREQPRLRMLLLTVDNTFMSPVALENVETLVSKLGVDHVVLRPSATLTKKIFAYAFTHLNERGCSGTVDQFDGDLIHDVARNYAAQHGIPLVLSGISRTQVERILGLASFESPRERERARREVVADIRLDELLDEDELRFFWDGTKWPEERIPRFLFPFYVWDLDEEAIKAEVARRGLIPHGDQSPIVTNSELVPLMGVVDVLTLGYSSFEPEFARMVRRGKADRRQWLHTFELLEYSAMTGRLLGRSLDDVLVRLGLTRQELGIAW